VTSQLAKEKWDFYVHNNPNATIYHTYSIREVIEKTFHHQCHYLSVIDDRQNVYAILPLVEMRSRLFGHFLVSIPFFNYGGILSSNQEASNILLKAAEELSQSIKSEHIEYRHCHDSYTLPSKSEKIAMLKNLPDDIEQLWSGLGTKLRAQIKKAERNSFTVKVGNINLINDFYKVFSNNMRDLGTPVYSKALFENMLNNNETAAIIMLYHQNKPVSTAFLLGWRNTLEIPWASTIKPANKLDANMKLYWEVLKFSIQKGYKIFDFGRSSKDANTYRFKKQWGAKSHELYWHYWLPNNKPLPEINPNNPKYKIMISVWKKLPLWIANIIGPEVVKNLP
jgi:FemAB-related protein (PEP-CTERM system-associated)